MKFNTILLFVLVYCAVMFLHLSLLILFDLPPWAHQLLLSYQLNFLLAASIMWVLFKVLENNREGVYLMFMGSSLLKFILFFIVFYPNYKVDGEIEKIEILTFFVPYFVGLSLETGILVQKLNKI